MAQLAQGPGFDLPNALAGDGERLTNFLQRVLCTVFQTEAHLDDLLLTQGQGAQRVLQKPYVNGPYVISTLVPLTIQSQPPDQFLVQDMSNVPSEVAGLWEREFERRAAQKDFWAPATRDQAILQLRTFVANAAYAFSDVNVALSTFKSSVAEWISWK